MVEFLNVELYCPLLCKYQKIQYRYTVYEPDGKLRFSPFNGCENMNGCETCSNCLNRERAFSLNARSLDEMLEHYQKRPGIF